MRVGIVAMRAGLRAIQHAAIDLVLDRAPEILRSSTELEAGQVDQAAKEDFCPDNEPNIN